MKEENSIENLVRLQEAFNKTINGRIEKAKIDEMLSEGTEFSFPVSNMMFVSMLSELYKTKKGKSLIKEYISNVKKSSVISKAYTISETIRTPHGIDNASLFINEAVSRLRELDSKKYLSESRKLSSIVKECMRECGMSSETISKMIENNRTKIAEAVDYIIRYSANGGDIVTYANKINEVTEYVEKNNIITEDNNYNNMNINELNEEYSNLLKGIDESWKREAVESIMLCVVSGTDKQTVFESYKNECMALLEEGMENADVEKRNELSEIRAKLEKRQYNPDCVNEDILTLSELKHTLKD